MNPRHDIVAGRYSRGLDVALVWVVLAWHATNDLAALLAGGSTYRSFEVAVAAWILLLAIGVAASVLVLGRYSAIVLRRVLAVGAVAVGTALVAVVPPDQLVGYANWAWGSVGWFVVLLLLRRPLAESLVLIAVNSGVTFVALAAGGILDRVTVSRFATVVYGTAVLQVAVLLSARALQATAQHVAEIGDAEEAARRRRRVAEEIHAGRQERYQELGRWIRPLLAGLANGGLDPTNPSTQHRCAIGAARLRRLFAESDDVPDPLLHELEACADLADRRGVVVEVGAAGEVPALDTEVRRALTEAPLQALVTARRRARVTVVGRADDVAVSVVADSPSPEVSTHASHPEVSISRYDEGAQVWIVAQWRRGG